MNDKIPKQTKGKKTNKLKKNIPKPTPTPVDLSVAPLSTEETQLFLQQINSFLRKKEQPKREKVDDYKVLHSTINEFLDSFITFGYTFDGQRVLIQHYPSAKDKDAIMEFLKNVFILNNSKDMPVLGTDEQDSANE